MKKRFIILISLWCTTSWASNSPSQIGLIQLAELISKVASIPQSSSEKTVKKSKQTDSSQEETSEKSTTSSSVKNPNAIYFEPITSLDINIDKKYIHSPEIDKLRRILKITRHYRVIHLINNQPLAQLNWEDNIISVQPRSFVSMLEYLSNGVQVPPCVIEKGLVTAPRYPDGSIYNINNLTKDIFFVHMSNERPKQDVNLEVYYRNHWFWICDTDIQSKRTIGLVQQIYNFLSGNEKTTMSNPILTIPVK